ncbi:hypothetical protein [Paenibacillus sp. CMAA1364]
MQTVLSNVETFDTVAFFEKFASKGKAIQIFVTAAQIIRDEFKWDGSESEQEKRYIRDDVWGDVEAGLVKGIAHYEHCDEPVKAIIQKNLASDKRHLILNCQCCSFKLSVDEEGRVYE